MRKILLYLSTALVLAIAGVVGRNVADWALPPPRGGESTETLLLRAIDEANRRLPIMIDQHTRFDQVTLPAPKVLQNNYTLLNIVTPLPGEFATIERNARVMVVGRACSTPSVARLLDRGITNVYSYSTADGSFFGSIAVRNLDCRK